MVSIRNGSEKTFPKGETTMFDTLHDQIRAGEKETTSNREKIVRWTLVLLVTALMFIGFYLLPTLG
jgi:hypothetical protein